MTKEQFEAKFEAIPVEDIADRAALIYDAVWKYHILTPEQGTLWQARASSEKHPVVGKVTAVDTGYVRVENVDDPLRPSAMPPPRRHRDGRDEYPKPARHSQEFIACGPAIEITTP